MVFRNRYCGSCRREIKGRRRGNLCNACGLKALRERRKSTLLRRNAKNYRFSEPLHLQADPATPFVRKVPLSLDWHRSLCQLVQKWRQAELVLLHHFPAHENLLTSSRNEPTGPEFNRMEAAAECWKKNPNSKSCVVRATRALIDAITDVEHTTVAVGEMIIPGTQGGTLVGKGGILHILTALGKALNCANHERGETQCVGLSGVEQAVRNFETERYLADNWERDEALMETIRHVKHSLENAQSNILFSNIVAGCRAQCTDYRQAKWVVARAITESSIPVKGDISSTSLILAMRRSRFGDRGFSSSSSPIQCHVMIDVPLGQDQRTLIPWMQLTDTGEILCRSKIGGWYVCIYRTWLYRGLKYSEFSDVPQQEAVAISASNTTLIRRYPTYIRTRTSLSVDVVCKIGWFALSAPRVLQELYNGAMEGSRPPDPKRLGMHVMHCLREWNLYEAVAEQGVTERSISQLVVNTENVSGFVREAVMRCLRSIGGASLVLISPNGNRLYCTGGGSPMVDEQEKLSGSGFFLRRELQNHATRLMTKQGIIEAVAPQSSGDEIRYLLHGIHALCDEICGNLSITPDFSALQDLGDFSYRRNVPLQLVPGAYDCRQGRLEEEDALELRRNWRWVSVPDRFLPVFHEDIAVERTSSPKNDT